MNIKPSFFDDVNISSNEYSIWKKDVPPKKASEVRITEGILFKKSSRTNFWKSRFYVLFEDRLAYYKVSLPSSINLPEIEQSPATRTSLLLSLEYAG